MNNIIFTGYVGKCELKKIKDANLLSFSVAETHGYFQDDTFVEQGVTWRNCEIWGDKAVKLAKIMETGASVIVTGKMITKISINETDGKTYENTHIAVKEIGFTVTKIKTLTFD